MCHDTPQTHRAGWVMIDSHTIFQNGYIKVAAGRVKEAGTGDGRGEGRMVDHGPGLLMPSLVNAHTHLELCGLKNKIPYEKGWIEWVKRVISERDALGEKKLISSACRGLDELTDTGCGLVGEISSLGLTWNSFLRSNLQGVWFREVLGNRMPENPAVSVKNGRIRSLAAHAPHTTHPEIISELWRIGRESSQPVSIHLAESEDEMAFLSTGRGPWANFLKERGIDFSDWNLPVQRPLGRMETLGLLHEKMIAVHLIHADPKDFNILLKNRVNVCLCPRSNQNLHGRLPDVMGMIEAGLKPCLGTDSLASCDSLSIFDEMAFLAASFPNLRPETMLDMATMNGAQALGYKNDFGTLTPGKAGSFIYLPMEASNRGGLTEALVSGIISDTIETGHL